MEKQTARTAFGIMLAGILLVGCGANSQVSAPSSLSDATLSAKSRALEPYYAAATGKTGKELLAALNSIISKHTDLGYSKARNVMFGDLDDLQNQNIIECVYTGRDAINVTDNGSASSQSFNTEHSWPQSLGAEGPAKSDLHHLFPADVKTNGARSSYPFGIVKETIKNFPETRSSGDVSVLGLDAQGRQVFEPRDCHKGNLARALMYFYTCYAQNSGNRVNLRNFKIEKEILLSWSSLDPVDAAEKARNEKIFNLQGNRNPFVDHPEWAEATKEFAATRNYK